MSPSPELPVIVFIGSLLISFVSVAVVSVTEVPAVSAVLMYPAIVSSIVISNGSIIQDPPSPACIDAFVTSFKPDVSIKPPIPEVS